MNIICLSVHAEQLRDIRGPVAIPGDLIWLWVLAAVLAAGVLYFALRMMKRRVRPEAVVVPKLSWEIALEELGALAKEDRTGEGKIKWFYSRLSEIIRVYIERRFEIRAPEMTTEEFFEKVRSSAALTGQHKSSLQDLLNSSDLVKFAKTIPSGGDMEEALRFGRKFVEETRIAAPEVDQQLSALPSR